MDDVVDQAWDGSEPAATADPDRDGGAPSPAPPPGDAIARLYLPTLDKYWVVVEGVGLADIRYAPGPFPDTALPGQVGNFSVAGHRNPATFWDLDKVDSGAPIVVETRDAWYTYQVTGDRIVGPAAAARRPGRLTPGVGCPGPGSTKLCSRLGARLEGRRDMEYLGLLLVVLACPVMMGVMMWMMRGKRRPAPPAQPAGNVQEEIAILRATIAMLRAGSDPSDRSEGTSG